MRLHRRKLRRFAEYRTIADASAWFTDDITRPLVALRMIEEESDKDLRAILWKRYNQLTGEDNRA